MPLPIEVDQFLSEKRARKATKRRWRKLKFDFLKREAKELQRIRFGDRSRIVRMLGEAYSGEVRVVKGRLRVTVPKTFSIIDDPIQALMLITKFAKSAREHRIRTIEIDQSSLERYDLAANAVLDTVATELVTECKQRGTRLNFKGQYPRSGEVRRFIKSLGIVKHLNLPHEANAQPDQSGLRVFDRRNCHYLYRGDPTKADFKTRTITSFIDHINNCLGDQGRQLTPAARQKLGEYIGEILGNAEEHAGMVDWTIQGYLDNAAAAPLCEIAIFNFGHSIADTLERLDPASYTRKQIAQYVLTHRGFRFFGPRWREVDLFTLAALQGHVSSKNVTALTTRGQGTVDLIEFFQKMYAECRGENCDIPATMAIVSGSTHILFDGTYSMRNGPTGGKVIAFNSENTLAKRPDESKVRSLGSLKFPGTIISIRFPLSRSSTVALGAPNHGQDREH